MIEFNIIIMGAISVVSNFSIFPGKNFPGKREGIKRPVISLTPRKFCDFPGFPGNKH
jgi:hypothetical protein